MFTTLRVYHQSLERALTNWQGHCDRLRASIQTFGWQQPNWNRLRQGAELLMSSFPVLRITIFPDSREWITGRSLPPTLTDKQIHGIEAIVLSGEQRCLPAHKTGNYLSAWLARNAATQMSASEAILVDANGNWLETSTGNLWGWQDGSWWTPPLEAGILPGVARSQLINWLNTYNCQVKQKPWTPEIVRKMEALAYTNSVVEVIPIHTATEWQVGRDVACNVCTGNVCTGKWRVEKEKINKLSYDPDHPAFKLLKGLFAEESDK